MRSATRWPAVAAALRRPNGNAVGALRTWCSGEVPVFERLCHIIVVGKGEATLVLPGLLGSRGDAELAPTLLVVEDDGGERLDGGLRPYQLSPHREGKI